MKTKIVVLMGLLALPLASLAQDPNENYQRLVDEVLEVTGALKIGEQMSSAVVAQLVQALKSSGSTLPDRAYDILEDEVQSTIREEMESGSFHEMMYPIYARHLNESDLEAALAFFETTEGRKYVQAMPAMAAEGMQVGQAWGASLGPKIAERVQQRLTAEGFDLQ